MFDGQTIECHANASELSRANHKLFLACCLSRNIPSNNYRTIGIDIIDPSIDYAVRYAANKLRSLIHETGIDAVNILPTSRYEIIVERRTNFIISS